MPWAFLYPDGTIKQVVNKPTPFMRIEEGERLVRYNPPEFDAETQNCEPVVPVPGDAEEVGFTLSQKDSSIVFEVQQVRLNRAVQVMLDSMAVSRGYDNIVAAVSYAGSTHPVYGQEGTNFRNWRDACWDYTFQVYLDVQAGDRPMPETFELLAELPVFQG